MATALAAGLCRAGAGQARQIMACDPDPSARQRFADAVPGARVEEDAAIVARDAQVLWLAVKPAAMAEALRQTADAVRDDTLVVSIAAGVRLKSLETQLGPSARVVRVMPNTPCLVGRSASAFSRGRHVSDEDAAIVSKLLEAVGVAYELPETLLDAVTGLSGSGPAFVYSVIEALADGGVLMGIPRDVALALAAQTVSGAAEMVLQTGEHPAVLRDRVTSPGGTTIAGMEALEREGLRAALMSAVQSATQRAQQLAAS